MSLFRKQPPVDLLEKMVQSIGLNSIEDTSWFVAQSIDLSKFEDYIVELHPYYTPSKNIYTSRPLTSSLVITILRQVLKEHSRGLNSKVLKGVAWYSILQPTILSSARVDFS
jgi:hypothetical protein